MAKNTFCHIEFYVRDLAKAQQFYEGLFEWTFRSFGDEMVVFGIGDQHLGGLVKSDDICDCTKPSIWIEADLLETYMERAVKLGGKVLSGRSEVPSVGWSCALADPDGNPVGLVQFAK
jgi:uncharacterized protein